MTTPERTPEEGTPPTMADMLHDDITVMQAAWIEWRHGGGAEEAMRWIHNTLSGPGLIPEGQYDHSAQKWFDANRSRPFPKCWCGEPSHIYTAHGGGACSQAHLIQPSADEGRPK